MEMANGRGDGVYRGPESSPVSRAPRPMPVPLSVLDLAPVPPGSAPADGFRNMVELARLADRLGFVRYWLAEHHGMPNTASSSPEVLIEHVASRPGRIRVGSGGIMLPNHAPL